MTINIGGSNLDPRRGPKVRFEVTCKCSHWTRPSGFQRAIWKGVAHIPWKAQWRAIWKGVAHIPWKEHVRAMWKGVARIPYLNWPMQSLQLRTLTDQRMGQYLSRFGNKGPIPSTAGHQLDQFGAAAKQASRQASVNSRATTKKNHVGVCASKYRSSLSHEWVASTSHREKSAGIVIPCLSPDWTSRASRSDSIALACTGQSAVAIALPVPQLADGDVQLWQWWSGDYVLGPHDWN